MSRRDELMAKNANIRSTDEITEAELRTATPSHRPRSGQGSFAQRQRLEDRVKELEATVGPGGANSIALSQISPNPWQPRRVFVEEEIKELARSISEVGLIQPIILRSVSNRDTSYQIVAGERRFRAHVLLGKNSIKAVTLDVSDADMATLALAENMDRADLSAYEIAVAIRNAEASFPNKTNLAEAVGLNRTVLYKYLAFFKLPEFVIVDLEVKPDLLGRDAADSIARVLEREGEKAITSLESLWPRLKSGELDQGKIVDSIVSSLRRSEIVRTQRDIRKLFVGEEQAGSITRDAANFTVKIRTAALTSKMETELRAFVEKMFSGPGHS
jgi:ParB family chromosome partitioning protein